MNNVHSFFFSQFKKLVVCFLLLLVFESSFAQSKKYFYLKNRKDTTQVKKFRLNRIYSVTGDSLFIKNVKIIRVTDSTLIYAYSPEKIEHEVSISRIRYIDNRPVIIQQFAYLGGTMLVFVPLILVASPIVGFIDGWDEARDGFAFAGMLGALGVTFASPSLLYKSYDVEKKWIISKNK